ncbi:MAG: hypothetical protein JW969_03240 [Spirochaetales bacterium]|nr:hypothetical protein [Spirochaetales bacterium]
MGLYLKANQFSQTQGGLLSKSARYNATKNSKQLITEAVSHLIGMGNAFFIAKMSLSELLSKLREKYTKEQVSVIAKKVHYFYKVLFEDSGRIFNLSNDTLLILVKSENDFDMDLLAHQVISITHSKYTNIMFDSGFNPFKEVRIYKPGKDTAESMLADLV